MAVRRYNSGDGQCEIRSHGLEKALYCRDFPSHVVVLGLNVVQWLEDNVFSFFHVWQDGDCLRDAGGITVGDKGWGRLRQLLPLCVPVPNPAAAAVDVHNAVDFAAALHALVKDWPTCKKLLKKLERGIPENIITVDAQAESVSYQQGRCCIIFRCSSTPYVQLVNSEGLPPSFIRVERAQQVRLDAREMKPNQNTNVQPLAAPTSNRKHASPHLPSSAAPQQPQALLTRWAAAHPLYHVSGVEALHAAAAATGIQAAAAFA